MSDFEESVQKLTDLKDTLDDVDDQIAERAAVNKSKMDQLNRDLADNKLRAINEAVEDLGKVIISSEELEELRQELTRVKEEGKTKLKEQVAQQKQAFDEKLKQSLEVQSLKHERETAKLQASVESYEREIENLKDRMRGMGEELSSQKELTANVAGASRKTYRRKKRAPELDSDEEDDE